MLKLTGTCLNTELKKIRDMVGSNPLSLYFDGTTEKGEVLVGVIRFWNGGSVSQKCISFKHFDAHLNQQGVSGFIIHSLRQCEIPDSQVISVGHDSAAVNFRAVRNLQEVTILKRAYDTICWCHVLSNTGKMMKMDCLEKFLSYWQSCFAQSPKMRLLYEKEIGTCPYINNYTRWFCKYEVVSTISKQWSSITPFIEKHSNQKNGVSILSLKQYLSNKQIRHILKIELFTMVAYGKFLTQATYLLEGDSTLLPFTYDILHQVKETLNPNNDIFTEVREAIVSLTPSYPFFERNLLIIIQS